MQNMIIEGLKKILFQIIGTPRLIYNYWCLSQLKQPLITVFGGKRVAKDSNYYNDAYQLSSQLARDGYSILTGGGPGIMEAALCGAMTINGGKQALGIGVSGVDIDYNPLCKQRLIFCSTFAIRKQLLIHYSQTIIVFPGGYGTIDELMEVFNLLKLNKIPKIRVILYDSSFWLGLQEWFDAQASSRGYSIIDFGQMGHIVDSIEEIVNLIA